MPSNIVRRGPVFYFRARIPEHLVGRVGRTHVSISLRTSDQAQAKRLAREHRVALEQELEALDAKQPSAPLRGSVLHLSDSDIEGICDRYRAQMLAEDEIARIKGLAETEIELDADIFEAGLPELRRAYARGDLGAVYVSLKKHLDRLGLDVARQSPAYERLARQFQQVEIEVYEGLLKRRRGIAVDAPAIRHDQPTLPEVFKCWLRQKPQNPKTVRAFEQVFNEFQLTCRAPTAAMVRKSDAVTFRNALQDRGDRTPQTISKMMGFLRAAFQCAVDDGLLDTNPIAGVKVVVPPKKSNTKPRLPFTVAELQLIFDGPIYQAGFVPRPTLGAACYWLPLLALYTGARLEELAQLHKQDVCPALKLGHYIAIRESAELKQEVKTASSVRNVPVHAQLVELGFLDYVKSCEGRLFPALEPDKFGVLSSRFSLFFGRYLDGLGITDTTRVFHSFRHCFVEECKTKARVIPPEVREAIVGHLSPAQIEATYGASLYPLPPQFAAMKHVEYRGLRLSHLKAPGSRRLGGAQVG